MAALREAGFSRNPVPAGRTDLGVHARMQVLSLRVVEGVPAEAVAARVSRALPASVGIALSRPAPRRFNAAWSASGKAYRYRLALAELPAWAGASWRVAVRPERVAELLARAVGTRNFRAFHDKSSAERPRTVRAAQVVELGGGLLDVRLEGDAFGRFMVRNLVGAAVAVARGERSEEEYRRALEEAAPLGRVRAPAEGLVLWEVHYPPPLDPFAADRAAPAGLPDAPPFRATPGAEPAR